MRAHLWGMRVARHVMVGCEGDEHDFGHFSCTVAGTELDQLAEAFDRLERSLRARKMLHGHW